MDAKTLVKLGIRLDYCPDAMVPEIPYIEDVLYVLGLTDSDRCFKFCVANHSTYVTNVALVAAAVGGEVLNMERYDEKLARRMIASAIIDLCPDNARCLLNAAYTQARQMLGDCSLEQMSAEEILCQCDCPSCRKRHGADD